MLRSLVSFKTLISMCKCWKAPPICVTCAIDAYRTVYMSAAANALRVAKMAPSLTELVRIATGEPKADVVQHQPDEDVRVRASHDPGTACWPDAGLCAAQEAYAHARSCWLSCRPCLDINRHPQRWLSSSPAQRCQ